MRRLLITFLVVGALAFGAFKGWQALHRSIGDFWRSPECTATTNGMDFTLDPEQTEYAAIIAAVGIKRGMAPRAITIALATAMQESKLRNLSYGDSDSLGLFQQRPSQGWGTAEQILRPEYAATQFFKALKRLVPNYASIGIGEAAQKVQRSADPEGDSYQDHALDAGAFASALTGNSPHGMSCWIEKPTSSHPATATAEVTGFYTGVGNPVTSGLTTTFPITGNDLDGWAVAEYLVAQSARIGIIQVSWDSWTWTYDKGWNKSDAGQAGVVALFVS